MPEKTPSVLIVDDEPLNLEVLEAYMHGTGYRITRAESGEEALRAVGGRPPDLVLLDVMMPGMDGLEVCRRLKDDEATRFIPVVMVTSLDGKSDRIGAIEAGADDFISKPVDRGELLARVRSLLRVKSLHDQLEDRYREVLDLQIMKDNLTHMLVHDFRNPLTSILGYLDIISMQSENEGCRQCLQFIHNSKHQANKLVSMVNDIMDLARLEKNVLPLKLDRVGLAAVAEENLFEFRRALEDKGLSAGLTEETEAVYVDADRTLLGRVVGNVLANAIRHSPEGGAIRLVVGCSDDGMAALSVSDDGPGMPEDALDKVFEKFYQVEAKAANLRSGAGLGLAFCKMAVKAHGGDIKAVNNPDRGCCFTIYLPRMRGERT